MDSSLQHFIRPEQHVKLAGELRGSPDLEKEKLLFSAVDLNRLGRSTSELLLGDGVRLGGLGLYPSHFLPVEVHRVHEGLFSSHLTFRILDVLY